MKQLLKEYQVWAFLADEYERGHSDVSLRGICLSLSGLVMMSVITREMERKCANRLRARFLPPQPRWWQLRKKRVPFSAYYWPPGERLPRAEACNTLFYEAWEEHASGRDYS